ncbi:unnamed protein product, partial [Iphiclides podalirius]
MFNTNQFVEDRVRSKRNKIQAKQFSEIIHSPVRAIINAPFKCPARQNLQSHMSSFCKMSTRSSEKLLYTNRSRNESSVVSKIYNSTEQWKNRCDGNNDPPQIFPIIQDKRQIHIPTWRLGLFKN